MKSLIVTKIVKEINFEEVWDELESKKDFQRQSVIKYLRLTLFFKCNSEKGKSLISFFPEFFASIAKILILVYIIKFLAYSFLYVQSTNFRPLD